MKNILVTSSTYQACGRFRDRKQRDRVDEAACYEASKTSLNPPREPTDAYKPHRMEPRHPKTKLTSLSSPCIFCLDESQKD